MRDEKDIDGVARAAIEAHLKSRSMLILEAAIIALLDSYSFEEVIAILRAQAEHLEQFG